MRKIHILIVVFCTFLIVVSCAKRGTITGGDKDIMPPKITSSFPENFSKNFNKNTIKITFDEYVKIKDLQKKPHRFATHENAHNGFATRNGEQIYYYKN